MKKNRKNLHLKRILAVIFAVIASLFVVLNQGLQHQYQEKYKEIVAQTPDGEEQAPENNFSIVASEAIVPLFQVGVAFAYFFIFELSTLTDHNVKQLISAPIYINDYYKTLFSDIISPNAP